MPLTGKIMKTKCPLNGIIISKTDWLFTPLNGIIISRTDWLFIPLTG
jgi:hypothetical protein